MTSMPRNVHPFVQVVEDADKSPVSTFRDRIALRNEAHAREFPRALNKEAACLYVIHLAVNGEAESLRGTRSAQGFRAALWGEKNFTLSDLCRLATDPRREARAAVKAALNELAASIGYELKAIDAKALPVYEALAGVAQSSGKLQANLAMTLEDGKIDEHEARSLEPDFDLMQRNLDHARATVRAHKGQE